MTAPPDPPSRVSSCLSQPKRRRSPRSGTDRPRLRQAGDRFGAERRRALVGHAGKLV